VNEENETNYDTEMSKTGREHESKSENENKNKLNENESKNYASTDDKQEMLNTK